MISLNSVSDSETDTVIGALTLMALSLSDGDHNYNFRTLALDVLFEQLSAKARNKLRDWSLLRAFTVASNIFKKEGWRFDEGAAEDFSKQLGAAMPKIKADTSDVSAAQLTYLSKLRTYFKTDSAPAWKYIVTNVKTLKIPKVSALFVDMIDEVHDAVDVSGIDLKRMTALTKKLSGRVNDYVMTPIELSRYAEAYPKDVEQYRAMYKLFNTAFKLELRKMVRMSGKDKINVAVVSKKLKSLGLDNTPQGFIGLVDEDAKYYTAAGHLVGGSIVGRVVMNPTYDAKKDNTYVCKSVAVNKNGRNQEWRTLNFIQSNQIERFQAVKDAAMQIKKLRSKWSQDLTSSDAKTQAIAALVEVAHTTLARIGGLENKTQEGEPTYGLSTLRLNHVKVDEKGAHFNYEGKKGTAQPATLFPRDTTCKKAIEVVKRLVRGKRADDFLFTYNGNRITANDANKYIKSLGFPAKFTIHKFRHLAGTNMFIDIISNAPFKKNDPKTTQSAVEKWYKEAMKPIGEALHHRTGEKVTGMTAVGAYIDVTPQRDFFKDLGLREPNFLAKKKAP